MELELAHGKMALGIEVIGTRMSDMAMVFSRQQMGCRSKDSGSTMSNMEKGYLSIKMERLLSDIGKTID